MVGTDDVPAGRVLTVDDLERIRARRHMRAQLEQLEAELEHERRSARLARQLLELDDAGTLELSADVVGELTRIVAEGGDR